MRRATITLPDGLDEEVERFRRDQPARPSLTSVVQAALERYLQDGPEPTIATGALERVLRHRGTVRRIVSYHGGSNPRLFGSVARGEAGSHSDVDVLVDLEAGRTLFDLAAMRADLEDLLDTAVDVVSSSGLDDDIRDEILTDVLAL